MEQRTFHQRGRRQSGGPDGLTQDVLDAYRFLVQTFVPRDQLYFVGFSRGAYVIRTLVGMVARFGVLRREEIHRIPAVYRLYRGPAAARLSEFDLIDFRHRYSHETNIDFVGVWDTVGPLGIPGRRGTGRLDPRYRRLQFHDSMLSSRVLGAYHALAIDEQRSVLRPSLWQTRRVPGQEVVQMWFPGDHDDVGGGYAGTGLSDISLKWMLARAREHGLAFRAEDMRRVSPNVLGEVHDSRAGAYRLWSAVNRPIGVTDPMSEQISDSARERVHSDEDYRPPGLVRALRDARDNGSGRRP